MLQHTDISYSYPMQYSINSLSLLRLPCQYPQRLENMVCCLQVNLVGMTSKRPLTKIQLLYLFASIRDTLFIASFPLILYIYIYIYINERIKEDASILCYSEFRA